MSNKVTPFRRPSPLTAAEAASSGLPISSARFPAAIQFVSWANRLPAKTTSVILEIMHNHTLAVRRRYAPLNAFNQLRTVAPFWRRLALHQKAWEQLPRKLVLVSLRSRGPC